MKKRIISLILVVALMFLTLTGCSFNYAKSDMSKYAALNQDFMGAIQHLVIEDGTFGTDEVKRWEKVEDAIAAALLGVAEKDSKKFAGKPDKYDSLAFCYYAVYEDENGNKQIVYASKMDESKTTSVQLGLTSLEGLNKAVSDAILAFEGDALKFYSTSSATVAGENDILSVTYTKTEKDNAEDKGTTFEYESVIVGKNEGTFDNWLKGKPIGVKLDGTFEAVEGIGEAAKTYIYSDVKINSELKSGSSAAKVGENALIYITYTATIDEKDAFGDDEAENVSISIDGYKAGSDGKYTKTYTSGALKLGAQDAADAEKTFLGQLVGKSVGSVSAINDINEKVNVTVKTGDESTTEEKVVPVDYSNIKIHWIVNEGEEAAVEFTFKPTETSTTDVWGQKIEKLNEKELTYYVFPVSYVSVDNIEVDVTDGKVSSNVSAETIITEFYSTVASTKTDEHDETEEHDHDALVHRVFASLESGEYKNGEKDLATLVDELVALYKTQTTNDKAVTTATTSLETALKNLAKDTSEDKSTTKESLRTKVTNARTEYSKAKKTADESQVKVDEKIAEILACKKGEEKVDAALASDYAQYQYDTLETSYKNDIKNKLAAEILKLAEKNITYDKLPKRAVKDAYNAIMNTHKYDFYEGKNGTSSTAVSNYEAYKGDFDAYLIATVAKEAGKDSMSKEDVEAYIQSQAEETVRGIILIYVLADELDLNLTKEEMKKHKKYYKDLEAMYAQYAVYGLTLSYTLEDYINAKQFDKVFDYFFEEDKTNTENTVVYLHIAYTCDNDAEEK